MPDQRQLVAIVHAADTLCCDDAIGFNPTGDRQFTDELAGAKLVPPQIEVVRAELATMIADANIVLGA